MPISAALLPEFDHEMANTRRVLERVPEDKMAFKPHPKSPTMSWLAGHVANLASWSSIVIGSDDLDLAQPGPKTPEVPTRQGLLEMFDRNVKAAREAIASASDAHLMSNWSLKKGPQTLLTMPKAAVLRSFVMNHMIHHRAQLTVYLRLNDVPVPALYGPSADESGF